MWEDRKHPRTICLFDVDGTLTPPRRSVTPEVKALLKRLRKICVIGFVGGSDLSKQVEQLGPDVLGEFDYCFAENGLTAYRLGEQLASQSFIQWIGEDEYKKLTNFVLNYIADLKIPQKRGTFIEFRNGMINISPIGRNCSHAERDAFEVYDKEHNIRIDMVNALKENFTHLDLTYSIGGQISFDVFPTGWDKTYALRHIEDQKFDVIHFFGDKTFEGGNDHEIFTHPLVTGHTVRTPDDTMRILTEIFALAGGDSHAELVAPKAPQEGGLMTNVLNRLDAIESRFDKLEQTLARLQRMMVNAPVENVTFRITNN